MYCEVNNGTFVKTNNNAELIYSQKHYSTNQKSTKQYLENSHKTKNSEESLVHSSSTIMSKKYKKKRNKISISSIRGSNHTSGSPDKYSINSSDNSSLPQKIKQYGTNSSMLKTSNKTLTESPQSKKIQQCIENESSNNTNSYSKSLYENISEKLNNYIKNQIVEIFSEDNVKSVIANNSQDSELNFVGGLNQNLIKNSSNGNHKKLNKAKEGTDFSELSLNMLSGINNSKNKKNNIKDTLNLDHNKTMEISGISLGTSFNNRDIINRRNSGSDKSIKRKKKKRSVDDAIWNEGNEHFIKKTKLSNSVLDNNNIVELHTSEENNEAVKKKGKSKKDKNNQTNDINGNSTSNKSCKNKTIDETNNKLGVDTFEVFNQYKKFEENSCDQLIVNNDKEFNTFERNKTFDLSPQNIVNHNSEMISDKESLSDADFTDKGIAEIKWNSNIARTNQDLDYNEMEILQELNVVLPFETIPLLHLVKRPSKPTSEEIQQANLLNAKLGPFSKEEDKQIRRNWKNFCKDHDINLPPSAFFKFHKVMTLHQRIKFVQYLSYKLNNRLPSNVYYRFRRIFSDNKIKTGRFTEEEDNQIIQFMKKSNSKTPYRDLGDLLGRPPNSIQRRFMILVNAKYRDTLEWDLDLCQRLIEGMFTVTGLKNIEDLQHVTLDAKKWRQLSNLLDHIPVKKLHRAWMLHVHPRLFSKETNDVVKRDLIKLMQLNKETDFRTVNWKKYAENFDGINELKLYELFENMMRHLVPEEKWSDLGSVIKCLSKEKFKLTKIKRYIYEDGKLKKVCPLKCNGN